MAPSSELDPEKYEPDDQDGLPRELVGDWVQDKQNLVARYVDISSAARRKYIGPKKAGATYIDLFSGPGRARIRETSEVLDGSPLVAWHKSVEKNSPFSHLYIADANKGLLDACSIRLQKASAPVKPLQGEATVTIDQVVESLHPDGLHFAFLDPYDLRS